MASPLANRILYAVAVIANFVLTSAAIQLGAGRVPIPEAWQWTVPILSAAITGALMFLPRAGGEHIAAQVDALKAQGVPRHEQMVVSKAEWASLVANDTDQTEMPRS